MPELKTGDKFPQDVSFCYVPWNLGNEDITVCGRPITFNASNGWADKRVVLFSVPGAFTPTCSESHLPGYIANKEEFNKKGVDVVAVLAYNDSYVMNAWSKANGIKNDEILFLEDKNAEFSKSIGWNNGERTARYAIVIDKGYVVYAAKEDKGKLDVSSAEAVLAKL